MAGDRNHDVRAQKRHAANDFLRDIWAPKVYISAGGYDRDDALRQADERGNELVAFGRIFIANVSLLHILIYLYSIHRMQPDLPVRLEKNLALTAYDRKTFYLMGDTSGRGYTDYPFVSESKL